jgi:hypothetical protein
MKVKRERIVKMRVIAGWEVRGSCEEELWGLTGLHLEWVIGMVIVSVFFIADTWVVKQMWKERFGCSTENLSSRKSALDNGKRE